MAQTAVWLHAAGHVQDAKAFADTALHQAFREQEPSASASRACSPYPPTCAPRSAVTPSPCYRQLRARHLALLFHNLVTAGGRDDARAMLGGVMTAVRNKR